METLTKESTTMNVKEVNKKDSGNKELIERWQIPNSPFTVVSINGEHFGTMGEYRLTDSYESRGKCEDELMPFTWNRMIQVVMILDEIKKKDPNFDKKVNDKLNNK